LKYRRGARDHKEKLWEKDELELLYEALAEWSAPAFLNQLKC